ncbi:hypothetical protein Ocin01_06933, partial [Orchesella cincta]
IENYFQLAETTTARTEQPTYTTTTTHMSLYYMLMSSDEGGKTRRMDGCGMESLAFRILHYNSNTSCFFPAFPPNVTSVDRPTDSVSVLLLYQPDDIVLCANSTLLNLGFGSVLWHSVYTSFCQSVDKGALIILISDCGAWVTSFSVFLLLPQNLHVHPHLVFLMCGNQN